MEKLLNVLKDETSNVLQSVESQYVIRRLLLDQRMCQNGLKEQAKAPQQRFCRHTIPHYWPRHPTALLVWWVRGQRSTPGLWLGAQRSTACWIWGARHVSLGPQLSQSSPRGWASWLTGVSNDHRSKVTSQRKNAGRAQLHAGGIPATFWKSSTF